MSMVCDVLYSECESTPCYVKSYLGTIRDNIRINALLDYNTPPSARCVIHLSFIESVCMDSTAHTESLRISGPPIIASG